MPATLTQTTLPPNSKATASHYVGTGFHLNRSAIQDLAKEGALPDKDKVAQIKPSVEVNLFDRVLGFFGHEAASLKVTTKQTLDMMVGQAVNGDLEGLIQSEAKLASLLHTKGYSEKRASEIAGGIVTTAVAEASTVEGNKCENLFKSAEFSRPSLTDRIMAMFGNEQANSKIAVHHAVQELSTAYKYGRENHIEQKRGDLKAILQENYNKPFQADIMTDILDKCCSTGAQKDLQKGHIFGR